MMQFNGARAISSADYFGEEQVRKDSGSEVYVETAVRIAQNAGEAAKKVLAECVIE